jgi:hypothetical protein
MGNFLLGQSGGTPTLRDRPPTKAPTRPEPSVLAESSGTASKREKASAIAEAIAALADSATIDAEQLAKIEESIGIIRNRMDALEAMGPKSVIFTVPNFTGGEKIDNPPKALGEVLGIIAEGFRDVYLCGPAGSGKSSLGPLVAKSLGIAFCKVPLSGNARESRIVGTMDAHGKHVETEFIRVWESGGVILLDEVDSADETMLICLNDALASGTLAIPTHHDLDRRTIRRHEKTIVIAAGNTWGSGADSTYTARARQDGAFLDRFVGAYIEVKYDLELEKRLCPDESARSVVYSIRSQVETQGLRRIVGTRAVIAAARMAASGQKGSAIADRIMANWSAQDRAKIKNV